MKSSSGCCGSGPQLSQMREMVIFHIEDHTALQFGQRLFACSTGPKHVAGCDRAESRRPRKRERCFSPRAREEDWMDHGRVEGLGGRSWCSRIKGDSMWRHGF